MDGVASQLAVPGADAAQRGAAEHSPQAPTLGEALAGLTLQCPACKRVLCQTADLAFFRRSNKRGGHEVHLILPEEAAWLQLVVQRCR